MINKNGFTMVEVLLASSIFLSTVLIIIPIFNQVQLEQKVLSDRRWIANYLHEDLQGYLWDDPLSLPTEVKIRKNQISFQVSFIKEEKFIKGCVDWKNAKEREESFCLHGFPKK